MRKDGIVKRILVMAGITLLCLALFFAGALMYYRSRSNAVRDTVSHWEAAERGVYLCGAGERSEEDITAIADSVSGYCTDELAASYSQVLYDAAAEISSGARAVSKYDRIIKDIKVDYRYGGVRVYIESVVDYSGYGGYIFEGESDEISYTGKCTQTLQMAETDHGWKISAVTVEYEEK